ncbi:MucR family transcriptional regulator [Sphingomonas sp. DC2300-3]|uniref:MucR family transcriptional regulator n=1 Tax=unclassified Sphingomonas TaxID=196159 RepID=UPI003CF085D6
MSDDTANTNEVGTTGGNDTVELATALTVAWLSNGHNRVSADDVPAFLASMHQTLSALGQAATTSSAAPEPAVQHMPAVSVRKSLASPDHIISMIDGKPYRTLRRHLSTNGLTPDEYRQRYNLKADYPMVAPNYSESRRAMARKIGLGRKKGETVAKPATTKTPGRGRAKKDS